APVADVPRAVPALRQEEQAVRQEDRSSSRASLTPVHAAPPGLFGLTAGRRQLRARWRRLCGCQRTAGGRDVAGAVWAGLPDPGTDAVRTFLWSARAGRGRQAPSAARDSRTVASRGCRGVGGRRRAGPVGRVVLPTRSVTVAAAPGRGDV